jgi:hypothetical protein
MNGWTVAAFVAAAAGTLVAVVGVVGVVALRGAMARLHGAALMSAVAPLFFAAAVGLHEGLSAAAAKGLLTVSVVVAGSAAVTHASAVAIRDWRTRRHRA